MKKALKTGTLLSLLLLASIPVQTGAAPAKPMPGGTGSIRGWMTSADGSRRLAPMSGIREAGPADVAAMASLTVETGRRYQTMAGFGASITDASAWLIQNRLSPRARRELLTELFSPARGIGLGATRITIGASDFSLAHYSLADRPGQPEANLAPMRKDLLPVLQTMRAINPRLTIIATPWSAPAWMKDSGSLIKGRLKPANYSDFSRYLVSYSQAMGKAGVPIDYLTIQNEPHFEPADYPGMRMEPAQRAAFIAGFLGPALRDQAPGVKLLDWDHNWDQPESPIAVLSDKQAAPFITGVAWHCYGGEVAAQSLVHDRFPDKETWFTECAAGNWSPDWSKSFAWTVKTLIIGAPRNWAKGVVMWNVALDEKHGPHLGGCGDCRGLVTINSKTGAITREPEFYAFAHASRFVKRGSVRVASDSNASGVESVAFHHARSGQIAMIVRNGSKEDQALRVVQGKRNFVATMPAGAVATLTWTVG